jgi:hypothetical protein
LPANGPAFSRRCPHAYCTALAMRRVAGNGRLQRDCWAAGSGLRDSPEGTKVRDVPGRAAVPAPRCHGAGCSISSVLRQCHGARWCRYERRRRLVASGPAPAPQAGPRESGGCAGASSSKPLSHPFTRERVGNDAGDAAGAGSLHHAPTPLQGPGKAAQRTSVQPPLSARVLYRTAMRRVAGNGRLQRYSWAAGTSAGGCQILSRPPINFRQLLSILQLAPKRSRILSRRCL